MLIPSIDNPNPPAYTPIALPKLRPGAAQLSAVEQASMPERIGEVARRLGGEQRDPTLDPARRRQQKAAPQRAGERPAEKSATVEAKPVLERALVDAERRGEVERQRPRHERPIEAVDRDGHGENDRRRQKQPKRAEDSLEIEAARLTVTVRPGGITGSHAHVSRNCGHCLAGIAAYYRASSSE